MVDVVDSAGAGADTPDEAKPRRPVPSWVITAGSLIVLLGAWEIFGRDVNPVFGSYPSAIAEAAWQLARTGKLWTALLDSLRPFFLGYGLAIVTSRRPSLLPGEEIGELDEILVLEVVHHLGHLGVVAAARIVLVAAQGLEQIVLALAGQPGDVFLPGIVGLVTEIAPMLLAQRARLVHARGVGIVGDRLRRR